MSNMNYLGKVFNNVKYVYNEINAATLTGAIDVVVVEQPDGTFTCSPFHVRFGKIGVLRSREKVVDIVINGEPVDIHMKLGESGEAFFVEEVSADELGDDSIPPHLACSPIPREGSFHERYLLQENDLSNNLNWPNKRQNGEDGIQSEEVKSSSLPKVVVAGGGNVVKTFKAETVEIESSRKLSSAAGGTTDFKPIVKSDSVSERESGSSTDSLPTKGLSGLDLNKEDESLSSERVSTSVPGSKRKRRKRSILKKKANNNAQRRSSNIDQADVSAALSAPQEKDQTDFDPIFQIEDIDQKSSKTPRQLELLNSSHSEELAHIKDAPVESDIHFFSDTELTPGCSPHDNHQFTPPVQSDTELETRRAVMGMGEDGKEGDQGQSWRWGELPTSSYDDSSKQSAHRSVLHNMLGLMKRTKHIRHNPSSQDGIYLSEINPDELDPEVAALYFPTSYRQNQAVQGKQKDEDAESGNGPSLPHSPHSVEGAIGGPKSLDSDFDDSKKLFGSEVAMSLCGGLTANSQPTDEAFLHHIITYDEFIANPSIVNNPNLVVRIDGKMFSWRVASPIITAWAAFQKPLPQEVVSRLNTEGSLEGVSDGTRQRRSYSSWFTWGVRSPERAEEQLEATTTDAPSSTDCLQDNEDKTGLTQVIAQDEETKPLKAKEENLSNSSDSDSENEHKRLKSQNLIISLNKGTGTDKFRKTLRLSSEQIASLNLMDGVNRVEFSVTTAYQGTSRCQCDIYKWRYDDKIVVSDIDGTITRSDVLGHILPIVGKDWAQSGVAKLFTKIEQNGYKILYLSSRAIGQARITRDYLQSIKQDQLTMPDGPMLLNPTSLINAFHREVIEKKPEEFKISCLRDIQALFPPNSQPFYAGYGNRINDVWAYQAVGIPIVRIFTINHRGELKHELTQTFQSSYSGQSCIVNDLFPPLIAG